ncbi:hypothetical protein BC835DRAFT_1420233 [Cytidiella melzeri]|nr:hypothetical protein BC835DRAFT_1420233 [Cytidiella melzeri]
MSPVLEALRHFLYGGEKHRFFKPGLLKELFPRKHEGYIFTRDEYELAYLFMDQAQQRALASHYPRSASSSGSLSPDSELYLPRLYFT